MKHRIAALLLPLMLLLCIAVQAQDVQTQDTQALDAQVQDTIDRTVFRRVCSYSEEVFSDVRAKDWFAPYVEAVYEYGLMGYHGEGVFSPRESITVAELLTISARMHSTYQVGAAISFASGEESRNWYVPYIAYLEEIGLLPLQLDDYCVPATRAQMAHIFASTLPQEWYDNRNAQLVTDAYLSRCFITDVDEYTPYQQEILWMYQQGILVGKDAAGSFLPESTVTRAEVAALLVRMIEPEQRLTPKWTTPAYVSAAGTAYSDLVRPPEKVNTAPDYDDADAIDALVRQALSAGEYAVALSYPRTFGADDATALAHAFTPQVKAYCEQMYNAVTCRAYSSGQAYLTFSSTAWSNIEEMSVFREQTMARAIEIHDSLWETGALTQEMNQYEIARVYYVWLCENCRYDSDKVTDTSLSHTAYGALCNGVAVCDGYTGAYDLLLKLEGIDCYALFNDEHIWTVATLDGTEYHIDTTWGDQYGVLDMSYFAMTAEQSRAKHAW